MRKEATVPHMSSDLGYGRRLWGANDAGVSLVKGRNPGSHKSCLFDIDVGCRSLAGRAD